MHSLGSEDFEQEDAKAAIAFAAAADAGVEQIVYLGGLGADNGNLSPHLRSRREVEDLLGASGVPVTTLRAAVVIGHGGISWEITRQLVAHLPAMITPKWVQTRTQPIALPDVIRYLVGVLGRAGGDGPGVRDRRSGGVAVRGHAQRAAKIINGRPLPVVGVPLLTPQLSSMWLAFVTDVDVRTGRNLVDSMSTEVVVTDDSIRDLVPGEPMGYDESVRLALVDRAAAQALDGQDDLSGGR